MCPELSVVIVNWNTLEMLKNCLESVLAATSGLPVEVLVVDNASTDGSVEMCEKFFPEVGLIKNGKNLGFGQANNQGILASKANLVLLLNSDTIVFPDSVEKMIKRMREDPSIGVLGCRLIRPDRSYQPSCMNYPSIKRVLVERLLLYKLLPNLPQTAIEPPYILLQIECDWVVGAAMLIRKRAIEIAGLFDPNILMYAEEMELCYRIKAAGWRIVFNPDAKIIHFGGGSWSEETHSPTFLKMIGLLFFFRKHFSIATYFAVFLLTGVGAMLRLFIWTLLYIYRRNERPRILLEIRSNLTFLVPSKSNSLLPRER